MHRFFSAALNAIVLASALQSAPLNAAPASRIIQAQVEVPSGADEDSGLVITLDDVTGDAASPRLLSRVEFLPVATGRQLISLSVPVRALRKALKLRIEARLLEADRSVLIGEQTVDPRALGQVPVILVAPSSSTP
jgi:hypothetical protein